MSVQQVETLQASFPQPQQLTLLHSPKAGPAKPQQQQPDLRSLPLSRRLSCIPGALAARFPPGSLSLVQVWTATMAWAGVPKAANSTIVLRTQPVGASLSDAALAPFRASCCEGGICRAAIGMLGKVWSSGSLAVVQNVNIIPTSVHPRNKLADGMTERLAELAYIPVYDLRNPDAGVVACLEVMTAAAATNVLVANVISHACDLLSQFQLSLGKPSASPPSPTAVPAPSPFAMPAVQVHQQPAHTVATLPALSQHQQPGSPCCAGSPAYLQQPASPSCFRQPPSPFGLPSVDRHCAGRATSASAPPLRPLRPVPGRAVSSGGSDPGTPTSPAGAQPPRRSLSMQRTTSVRCFDRLSVPMVIG